MAIRGIRSIRSRLRKPRQLRAEAAPGVMPAASEAAEAIRGSSAPTIMVFGVMPRAGTVHVGELLSLHEDIFPHPNELWELPFLENTDLLLDFQEDFFRGYRQNVDRMGDSDFLALFGAAFVAYLCSFAPAEQVVLSKETSMRHLDRFPLVFPKERLLLLMRDGRDLVSSSMRTWPNKKFSELCQRWADGARTMLDFVEQNQRDDYWLVRFEDILDAKDAFVREACQRYQLDSGRYPFESQSEIEVIGSSTISKAGEVDWSAHVAAPAGFKPTGHWHAWSNSQKADFKRIAGSQLRRAGYEDSDNW